MFYASSTLPYSLYQLMVDKRTIVNESYTHRPDRLIDTYEGQNLSYEALCNEVNNVSPFSFSAGLPYFLPSLLFRKYFAGV